MIVIPGHDLLAARHEESNARKLWPKSCVVRHNRIDLRGIDDKWKILERQVGRVKDNAARDAVELAQR